MTPSSIGRKLINVGARIARLCYKFNPNKRTTKHHAIRGSRPYRIFEAKQDDEAAVLTNVDMPREARHDIFA